MSSALTTVGVGPLCVHYHPIRKSERIRNERNCGKNHLFDFQFINSKTTELTCQNTLYSPQISAFSPLNNGISDYYTLISVPVSVRLSTLIVMTAVTTFQLFIIFIIDCYKWFVTITSLYRYKKNGIKYLPISRRIIKNCVERRKKEGTNQFNRKNENLEDSPVIIVHGFFSSSCRRTSSSQSKWTLIKITHHHHGAECFNDCIGWLFNVYHLCCIYIRYDVYKNCMTFGSLWEMEKQYTHKKYSTKMLNNYFVNYFVIQMWMWYIEKRVCCRWVRSTGRASSIPIPTKLIQHLAHILKGYPIIESL